MTGLPSPVRHASQAPVLQPSPRATRREVPGQWDFALDPENQGKALGWSSTPPAGGEKIATGRPWEFWHPGYDGVAWYWKELSFAELAPGTIQRICFGAVSYWCEAWLNGHHLGTHEGTYDEFAFDVTSFLKVTGGNLLAVRVINPPADRVIEGLRCGAPLNQSNLPTGKAAWYYNYGGIWGRVWLESLPPIHWRDLWVDADWKTKSLTLHWVAENASSVDECEMRVTVRERKSGRVVLEESHSEVLGTGPSEGTWGLDAEDLAEWSPDDPALYVIEAALISSHHTHCATRQIGLREFSIKAGRFSLNGNPVLLKGLLQQGSYPRRLAAPDSWRLAARELLALKRAGFNFLRIHLKPAESWYLDLADRLGILVMMEPPIGWIANTPETESRVCREIEALIRGHRSRACIVIWGLFNESFHLLGFVPDQFRKLADRMMLAARACDDSRLLIDTSGGYAKARVEGAETMIHDTAHHGSSRYMLPRSTRAEPIMDVHAYCTMPPTAEIVENYHQLDPGPLPLFVAEYGAAEMPPDFPKVLSRYPARDRDLGLEDWRLHEDFYQSLVARFDQAGLAGEFGGVDDWIAALNEERAREIAAITVALRRNPKVAGFCLCQLADASGELFGVLDFWRRPKPVLAKLSAAMANPAAGLFLKQRWINPGETLDAELAIVSDLAEPSCGGLEMEILRPDGKTEILPPHFFTCRTGEPFTHAFTLRPDQEGLFHIRCRIELPDGRVLETEETFGVLPRTEAPSIRIAARFAHPEGAGNAALCGANVEPFGNNYRDKNAVIVLEWAAIAATVNMHGEFLGQMRNIAESGGVAVILNPDTPMLHQWLLPAFIGVQPVMRTGVYLKKSPLLGNLPAGRVAGSLFASLLGDRWDNADQVAAAGGIIEIGAFSMHMWTRPARYFWGAGLYRIPLGRGQVIISHLNLMPRLAADPLARHMLRNLLAYARSFIQPGREELLYRRCIDRIKEREPQVTIPRIS